MPFHPVANTSECQVRYSHGTNQCENGFAYHWGSGPPTEAQLLALATEIGSTIAVKMANIMSNGVVFREVYCRNIDTEVANQATFVFTTNPGPGRIGNPVASNEAVEMVKRTGLTGRTHHGANRFSEFVEGDVDGNTLSGFIIAQVANIALSVLASRVGGYFVPALASRLLGLSTPLRAALALDSDVDSQKTRLNRHGST